jgi:hypothetical protein
MVDFVQSRLASISDVQTQIRHETRFAISVLPFSFLLVIRRLSGYREVLRQKSYQLSELKVIEHIPEAYLAALSNNLVLISLRSLIVDS